MAPNPPFMKDYALDQQRLSADGGQGPNSQDTINYVPDQPSVSLMKEDVCNFLATELETTILDRMYDWLWLCASKESKRIDALHHQVFKGRNIIATEDPALHLVWFKDEICVKPLPLALLNHEFWTQFLHVTTSARDDVKEIPHFDAKVALGFLRSYGLLIRHRSDLAIALEKGLLPKSVEWLQWERFIRPFRHIQDHEVAKRYHFGQLRLSRLNLLVRVLRPHGRNDRANNRHYYTMHWYTSAYLRQFVEAGIYVFASLSLMMSAMQVVLSLPSEAEGRTWVRNSDNLAFAFWGFCVAVLVGLAGSWVLLLAGPVLYFAAQQVFGYRKKNRFDRDLATIMRNEDGKQHA